MTSADAVRPLADQRGRLARPARRRATPVIDATRVAPGAYVTALGPKQQGRAEFGLDLPAAASLLVPIPPTRSGQNDPPNVPIGTRHERRLVALGAVRAGAADPRTADGLSLFFSVGLAGTEAFLLDRLDTRTRDARRIRLWVIASVPPCFGTPEMPLCDFGTTGVVSEYEA